MNYARRRNAAKPATIATPTGLTAAAAPVYGRRVAVVALGVPITPVDPIVPGLVTPGMVVVGIGGSV